MAATAADIGAASRDAVTVTWSSPAIAGCYPAARDGSTAPATGYFDASADAQVVNDARGTLIGVERSRFAVTVSALIWPSVSASIPQANLIDAEQSVSAVHLVSRLEVDLDAETTTLELFG
jgi:hypothetical protein